MQKAKTKTNTEMMFNNMLNFWKSGNSLVTLFDWLKSSYKLEDAQAIMSGFMKKYSHLEDLKKEFNNSCFIENTHKI